MAFDPEQWHGQVQLSLTTSRRSSLCWYKLHCTSSGPWANPANLTTLLGGFPVWIVWEWISAQFQGFLFPVKSVSWPCITRDLTISVTTNISRTVCSFQRKTSGHTCRRQFSICFISFILHDFMICCTVYYTVNLFMFHTMSNMSCIPFFATSFDHKNEIAKVHWAQTLWCSTKEYM